MNTYLVKAEGANLAQYHLKTLEHRRVTVGDVPCIPGPRCFGGVCRGST